MVKQLELVDSKTGEVVEGFTTFIVLNSTLRNGFRRKFMMNQDAAPYGA